MYYISSAFSLNMLPGAARVTADPLDEATTVEYLKPYLQEGLCQSVVGHESSAAVLSAKFGMSIPANRTNFKVAYGDSIYVIQVGTRLQEGQVLSVEELQAVPLSFWVVTVMKPVQ